jgi:hypothetical protein
MRYVYNLGLPTLPMRYPPSIGSTVPDTKAPAGEHKNTTAPAANHRRGRSSVSQSQEGSGQCQPITEVDVVVSANHSRPLAAPSPTQRPRRANTRTPPRLQPITGEDVAVSANQRRGVFIVSQSQEGSGQCQPITEDDDNCKPVWPAYYCQPITGGERSVSANHRTGAGSVSQSQEKRNNNNNKPFRPAWAVGALFRSARRIHINHVCENLWFHISPLLRSLDILVKGRRGAVSVSQSQEGSGQCQPITEGECSMSANHKRGAVSVSQSQKGSRQCQPITRGERAV